jgi:hypothetical protein
LNAAIAIKLSLHKALLCRGLSRCIIKLSFYNVWHGFGTWGLSVSLSLPLFLHLPRGMSTYKERGQIRTLTAKPTTIWRASTLTHTPCSSLSLLFFLRGKRTFTHCNSQALPPVRLVIHGREDRHATYQLPVSQWQPRSVPVLSGAVEHGWPSPFAEHPAGPAA